MPFRQRRALVIAIALLVTAAAFVAWWSRMGTFSRLNYSRIQPGMTLQQVEALLGAPGREISEQELPNHPTGPVVAGERFFRWEQDSCYIIISLKNGLVFEKDYFEPSF